LTAQAWLDRMPGLLRVVSCGPESEPKSQKKHASDVFQGVDKSVKKKTDFQSIHGLFKSVPGNFKLKSRSTGHHFRDDFAFF